MWSIHQTEVDGIPTVWVDGPAPLRAELMFRAGVADEPLGLRGITHLTEHLALTRQGQPSDMLNGRVEYDHCGFNVAGDERDIVHFFEELAEALHRPDRERLEHEARILRAESAGRAPGLDAILTARYGACGPGKLAHDEFGLHDVNEEDLGEWAGAHFTRGNAVLWLSGPPPAGLRIPLPEGERVPMPELEVRRDLELPSYQRFGQMVAACFEGRRDVPHVVTMTSFAIVRMLEERARYERGASYQVGAVSLRSSPSVGTEVVFADVSEGRSQSVVDSLLEVVDRLADEGDIGDIQRYFLRQMSYATSHPEGRVGHVAATAARLLHGREVIQSDQWERMLREVSAEDVRTLAGSIRSDATYLIPVDAEIPSGAAAPVPLWSTETLPTPVDVYRPRAPEGDLRIEVSDGGVAVEPGNQERQVVLSEDVQLKVRWHDGSVGVLNSFGGSIVVAPKQWERGDELVAHMDETFDRPAVTLGLRYWMPDGVGPLTFLGRFRAYVQQKSLIQALPVAFVFMMVALMVTVGGWLALQGLGVMASPESDAPAFDVVVDGDGMVTGVRDRQPADAQFDGGTLSWGGVWMVLGGALLALLFWWGGSRYPPDHRPKLLDRAAQHLDERFPGDLSTHKSFLPGGLVLGWLVTRDRTSAWLEESMPGALAEFRSGELTALGLYREMGAVLATDMADDATAAFLAWYFPLRHRKELRRLKGDLETVYHLPDSDETLARACEMLDRAVARWRRQPLRL